MPEIEVEGVVRSERRRYNGPPGANFTGKHHGQDSQHKRTVVAIPAREFLSEGMSAQNAPQVLFSRGISHRIEHPPVHVDDPVGLDGARRATVAVSV